MAEHKFSKAKEEINKIGLTKIEREVIFSKIIDKTKSALINSMPVQKSKISWVQNLLLGHHLRPAFAVFALIFLLGGSGLIVGSNNALPGNILYSFKVGVMEPMGGTLMTGE